MGRTSQPQPQPARGPAPEQFEAQRTPERERNTRRHRIDPDWLTMAIRIATGALLFIVALLVAAVVWFIWSSSPASENRLVDANKLQAIFLNNGQIYFGNVKALNKEYMVLGNVYYLQTSSNAAGSSSANPNVSLIKLGCELHKPYDAMVINTTEVTFWENLQSDGKVAKAVEQFQKENPNGQKCSDQAAAPTTTDLQSQTTTPTTKKQ